MALQEDTVSTGPAKVTIVGSGNWGSAVARILAFNTLRYPEFEDELRMWVFEETLESGEKLTEYINREHENIKYLPGIKLGPNVRAVPDLIESIKDSTYLVLVAPHQFLPKICQQMKAFIREDATAVSLIKGMEVAKQGPKLIHTVVEHELGIECAVLMGANLAKEVALDQLSEATLGCKNSESSPIAKAWLKLFNAPMFHVRAVSDVSGVELCGTLKNIVALGAGFSDGLGLGNNTKAAIMRIGLNEMLHLSQLLKPKVKSETFWESCGFADLITTCMGGRNRMVAEAYAKAGGKKSFEELEAEMLGGQKLQGCLTAEEVYEVTTHNGWDLELPLFSTIACIVKGKLSPEDISRYAEYATLVGRTPADGPKGDTLWRMSSSSGTV